MSVTPFHMNPRKAEDVPLLSPPKFVWSSSLCSPRHFFLPILKVFVVLPPSVKDQFSEQVLTAYSPFLHLLPYR